MKKKNDKKEVWYNYNVVKLMGRDRKMIFNDRYIEEEKYFNFIVTVSKLLDYDMNVNKSRVYGDRVVTISFSKDDRELNVHIFFTGEKCRIEFYESDVNNVENDIELGISDEESKNHLDILEKVMKRMMR